MKQLYLLFVLLAVSVFCYADTETLENSFISVSFSIENRNVNILHFIDKKSSLDFIKNPINTNSVWMISIKKHRDYSGKDIKLYPKDAENLKISKTKNIH